jgi:hypothetical protein
MPDDAKARRVRIMLTKMTLAAAVIGMAALFTPASAAPIAPQSAIPEAATTEGNLLVQVYHRHRYWHHRRHRHWHHRRHRHWHHRRHCRLVCHGHLHWRHGHRVCHGHWHRSCHWH